ncbi:ABC transporter ATP-binding protein [Colwellia psychrerythraea]|uniref:Phosphonate-transporting ATPase n=1 Tax=Colwellia psychrerythraea TaxID=28229 RepID=A0A099KWF7_COLPS|nr:ABC transporter ATP-binding protein [Colwellia psychrerythraea]KGJ94167.1 Phosphonate-transporting ATPase [Colwellia psychrerythraea]
MKNEALIKLTKLTKDFTGDAGVTSAIKGVDLTINAGEYLSIAGPSGCGKSTLLSILGLLETPSSGEYLLNGYLAHDLDVYQRAEIRNKEIGFIFQAFNLIGDLTVLENVALPLSYRKMKKKERDEIAMNSLEKVNMADRAKYYPAQLSGGQQQRIAVARSLVVDPSILLADEPTGNLDTANGGAIMDLFDELHDEGRTICMVTHDARFAKRSKRIVQLEDGVLR